jgi:hypothetical protein
MQKMQVQDPGQGAVYTDLFFVVLLIHPSQGRDNASNYSATISLLFSVRYQPIEALQSALL